MPRIGERARKARQIAELKALGWPVERIAAEVGIARHTVREYLRDPDGSQARVRRAKLPRGRCERCGAPTSAAARTRCPRHALRRGPARRWTPEKIVAALRLWQATYGVWPTSSDLRRRRRRTASVEREARFRRLNERGLVPSEYTVREVFGSLSAAIRAAEDFDRYPKAA